MDATADHRAYEDFVPKHDMVTESASHTLSVDLSAAGYKKEHIRVQLVRSHGLVVVRGERPVAGNRWSRFRLEFPVPEGCDVTGIHARFENGVVRVTMPGLKAGVPAVVGAGVQGPAAKTGAAAGVQDRGDNVAREKAGDHARGEGEKGDERVEKQQEEQHAPSAGKDGGRLEGAGGVGGEEAAAWPSRRGYGFLQDRRKLVTTVLCAVLVLVSLGICVRYNLSP